MGENPTGETRSVAPVVISGGGAGDQSAENPEVKVLVGGVQKARSVPTGGQASRQVVTIENRSEAPKSDVPTIESECGMWRVPSLSCSGEGQGHR